MQKYHGAQSRRGYTAHVSYGDHEWGDRHVFITTRSSQVSGGHSARVRSLGGAHKASFCRGDQSAVRERGAVVATLPSEASATVLQMFRSHG